MRIKVTILSILLSMPAVAVQAPLVAPGDVLFIRGKVIGCELGVHTIDYAEVDEHGNVVVLNNISLSVAGKPVHLISSALADALESQTGHRPSTLEIVWVSSSDQEQIAKRLMILAQTSKRPCRQYLEPADPALEESVSRIAHNKSFKSAPAGLDGAALRRLI